MLKGGVISGAYGTLLKRVHVMNGMLQQVVVARLHGGISITSEESPRPSTEPLVNCNLIDYTDLSTFLSLLTEETQHLC